MSTDNHSSDLRSPVSFPLPKGQPWLQSFEDMIMSPSMMDTLWADGWRHFGTFFFRNMLGMAEEQISLILPLRIRLDQFSFSKSQRRNLRKNEDVRVEFHDASLDEERHQLFDLHRNRFESDRPESLYNFLSSTPSSIPCPAEECCVYEKDRLIAVSYIDIGEIALSSVYAIYHPASVKRRPGIFTLLQEIQHAQVLGKHYLYLGYAYHEPSYYDYKKYFSGLEYYNWYGEWLPFSL